MPAPESSTGRIISHYQILEKIGAGGMGEIYKARDTRLHRTVAIKLIAPALLQDQKALMLFRHEAIAASAIPHPNICTIFEIDSTESHHFIVMEFVDGRSLRDILNEKKRIPQFEFAAILAQLCDALARVHEKGLVHRDIKPDNILISFDGKVKITDFGLAKLALTSAEIESHKEGVPEGPEPHENLLTSLSQFMGTILYMSPEQVRGEEIDNRTDIWSLGVVIYEAIIGRRPFDGEHRHEALQAILHRDPIPIRGIQGGLHRDWKKIIAKSLQKDKNERYRNADELSADLKTIAGKNERRSLFARLGPAFIAVTTTILLALVALRIKNREARVRPWLNPDLIPKRITSSPYVEYGRISPDGKAVVYEDAGFDIYKKIIKTGEISAIAKSDDPRVQYCQPSWASAGDRLIFMRWAKESTIIISDANGAVQDTIPVRGDGFCPCLSPDEQKVSYLFDAMTSSGFIIHDLSNGDKKPLEIKSMNYCWAPDSKHIAYTEINPARVSGLKIVDIMNGNSRVLYPKENVISVPWWKGGMAWSPDGRYIVYAGLDKSSIELFALAIDPEDYSVKSAPVQLTHYEGQKYPSWPAFTGDGRSLSYSLLESNTDIYLVSLDLENAKFGGGAVPVADDLHDDTSPCWTPDGRAVIFSSNREGNYELYQYDIHSTQLKRLTVTAIDERYPLVSPDGKMISYLWQGVLWGIRQGGEKPFRILPKSLVINRNYAWLPDGKGLVVSVRDSFEQNKSRLFTVHLNDTIPRKLFDGLSSPDFAFSPDGETLAITGFPDRPENIKFERVALFNLKTNRLTDLMKRDLIAPRSRISWTPDGRFILHDRYNESGLFYERVPVDGGRPAPLHNNFFIPEDMLLLDRIDPSGKRILITLTTEQSDVWLMGAIPE